MISSLQQFDNTVCTAAQAAAAVRFADSMREKFQMLMASGGGSLVQERREQLDGSEIEDVVEMCKRGLKLEAIADEMGRSVGMVWKVLNDRGLLRRRKLTRDPVRRDRGMQLLREGRTIPEVARECCVTRPAVRIWRDILNRESEATQ